MSLRDLLLNHARRPQAPRLRISQAGTPCVRDVYYRATGEPESEPASEQGLMKMALGVALDALLLSGDSPLWRFQVPVCVAKGGFEVRGTADAVRLALDGTAELVSDLKTVGDSTWTKIQSGPKQEHIAQVNLYAYGLASPSWSICYVNAGTGEILEHDGVTDAFAARKDFGLFEEAQYWIGRGEVPPRGYEDVTDEDGNVKLARDGFQCRFCRFRSTCWKEKEKENVREQPLQTA